MHAFIQKRMSILFILTALFCTVTAPSLLRADDDKDKNAPPARAVPIKPEAPAPGLTERERMLLDRVEQLEKRVAKLETKGILSTVPAAEVAASQPNLGDSASASAATIIPEEIAASVGPSAVKNVIPADKAIASVTEQATEKGKSGAANPATSEPFAFADFTWLNGNARTKESPMDTKFFTPEIRADVDYVYSFNHPSDDTIGGSSEVFRSSEVHVTQLGVGGDFHFDNVRARVMTQSAYIQRRRREMTPVRRAANGILTMPIAIFRKLTVGITST